MKKFLAVGVLALSAAICSVQPASAWLNINIGAGFNFGLQCGNNSALWGLWKCGPGGPFPHCDPIHGHQLPPMEVNDPTTPMPRVAPTSAGNQARMFGYPLVQPVSYPGYYQLPDYNSYNHSYYFPGYWFDR